MNILFVNSHELRCGVHQYGKNLYYVLSHAKKHEITYATFQCYEGFDAFCRDKNYDWVIYNWQAGIGGWMGYAPFSGLKRQALAYHDLEAKFPEFDAVLFSDPTMKQHDNWYPIGRPIRGASYFAPIDSEVPIIGVNGFIGAWAHKVVAQAVQEYEKCHIRMHLPHATYGDQGGLLAASARNKCLAMIRPGVTIEITHDFLEWEDLIRWLANNTINCYFRDETTHWRGVSSSLDAALCAGRPIAINRCNAFRHFFDCSPSILINDRSLRDIIATGLAPLVKKHEEYSVERVSQQVFSVLESLL